MVISFKWKVNAAPTVFVSTVEEGMDRLPKRVLLA